MQIEPWERSFANLWREFNYKRLDKRLARYDHERATYPMRTRALREINDYLDELLKEK